MDSIEKYREAYAVGRGDGLFEGHARAQRQYHEYREKLQQVRMELRGARSALAWAYVGCILAGIGGLATGLLVAL